MRIRNIILTFCLAIIFAFIFTFGIHLFNQIFIKVNLDYVDKAIGAFMGAFFAFLFVRIGDAFAKIYERQKKHYNALVRLEYICNDYLNFISDNIWIIDDFKKIADEALQKDSPFSYMNKLRPFSIDKEILLSLNNIDLINEVFSFNVELDKINSSIDTVNRFYEEIKDAFIQRKIDFPTYKINVQTCLEKLTELRKFFVALDKKTEKIVAIVRVLSKDKPLLTRFISFISKGRFPKKFEKVVSEEIKKLQNERMEVSSKSKKEIERTLKNES